MYTTKLTSARGFNPNNIIFSKPDVGTIPGSIPKISFKRIRIGVRHDDGSTGDLILETPPRLFSFGLQENRDIGSGNVNGYVMPMCLWNKNGASEEETSFTHVFESIVHRCKEHLLESRDEIERYDLDMADLKNLNPLYWKKEKGKIVEGSGPVLYIKTMISKKSQSINTVFINAQTNEEMDPQEVMNKYCFIKAAVKFESVFIGNKISLQIKLYEALIEPIDTERKTLLTSHVIRKIDTCSSDIFDALEGEPTETTVTHHTVTDTPPSLAVLNTMTPQNNEEEEEDDNDDDDGSLVYESQEVTMAVPPNTPVITATPPPPTPVQAPSPPPAPKKRGRRPNAVTA
jgi:hypothetical protein